MWAQGPKPPRILAFGDSLIAGYGLAESEAFPAQLARLLAAQNIAVIVVNGGVSGDTTSGGRARLDWMIVDRPDAVILELGANDALRGVDPKESFANLDAMLGALAAKGIPVLLAGMRAPPNMGRDYEQRFNAMYPALARKHRAVFYPFFLDGVAGERRLLQPDGLHPTAEGARLIAERIAPAVRTLIGAALP